MDAHTEKNKIIEFSDQLFSEVFHANNKLSLYMSTHNKFVDFKELANVSPSFFVLIMNSLEKDIIISTAKLFDNGRGSYGTMYKFLNLIEANVDLFGEEKRQILKTAIPNQRKELFEENEQILKNLKSWRDKGYAHPDKKYFLDSNLPNLADDSPLVYGDIIGLLKKCVEIINFYSTRLQKSIYSFDCPDIKKDLDTLFDILNNHVQSKPGKY